MKNAEEIKSIPIKWGIIAALVSILVSTYINMFMTDNFLVYMIMGFVILAIPVILFGIGAAQQRKALGGFIELREAFRAIFIMILIFVLVTNIYNYIYSQFIDTELYDKLRVSYIDFLSKAKIDQAKLDKEIERYDQNIAQQSSVIAKFLGVLTQIIVYSIFGFIIAAIVKKKRPVMGQ